MTPFTPPDCSECGRPCKHGMYGHTTPFGQSLEFCGSVCLHRYVLAHETEFVSSALGCMNRSLWEAAFAPLFALFADGFGYDNFRNRVFVVRPFFWGDCACPDGFEHGIHLPSCQHDIPNFEHYASGLQLSWYKYPFRSGEYNLPNLTFPELQAIIADCIRSMGHKART